MDLPCSLGEQDGLKGEGQGETLLSGPPWRLSRVSLRKSATCQALSRALTTAVPPTLRSLAAASQAGLPAPLRGKAPGRGQAASPADRALPLVSSLHLVYIFLNVINATSPQMPVMSPARSGCPVPAGKPSARGSEESQVQTRPPWPGPGLQGTLGRKERGGLGETPQAEPPAKQHPSGATRSLPERALQNEAVAVSDRP